MASTLSIAERELLTTNILKWKHIIGFDPAHGDDHTVVSMWITEHGTHQFLPRFDEMYSIMNLLERLAFDGYTVQIGSFKFDNTIRWECIIHNNKIFIIEDDIALLQAIQDACLKVIHETTRN